MKRTHEEFVKLVEENNPTIEIIGIYTKATDRIAVRCKECGYEWMPKAYSLTQGKSCKHCSARKGAKNNKGKTGVKSKEKFISELKEINPSIVIEGDYINCHTNIACVCSICGHSWTAKPYSLLQGHGCPRCVKSGTSFMEQFIKTSFEKALGREKVFSRDKTAIGMELDIYIPSLKMAIEPGNWYLHQKSLKRDEEKRRICKDKQINLITIYDKFPQDRIKPFDENCFVYKDDLNKIDHVVIIDLVRKLFCIANIQCDFTDAEWSEIEKEAYDNAKAKTHIDFVKELYKIQPTIEVLGEYKNANKKIKVRCKICNYEWEGVPANLLVGDGCKKCGTKKAHEKFRKEQAYFEEQVKKVNPNVIIIGEYNGRHNPIEAKCLICGHEWKPRASSLLRGSNHKGWKTIHKKLNQT